MAQMSPITEIHRIEAIEDFEPETALGIELQELALRGLEESGERLSVDEVMQYLGRPAYVEQDRS